MSFGSDLRRERETRGVGIADIAAGTKVSERHLRALEDDAIDALPGGVFNKGFVRSYCHFLALDQEAWAQRYADTFETGTTEPDWSAFAENVKRNRTATPSTGLRWWGVALMLVALAALAWGVWRYLLHGFTAHATAHSSQARSDSGPPVPPTAQVYQPFGNTAESFHSQTAHRSA